MLIALLQIAFSAAVPHPWDWGPPRVWDAQSIVYGEVKAVDSSSRKVTLRPIAILTGSVDALSASEVDAAVGQDFGGGPEDLPKPGTKVLTLVSGRRDVGYFIPKATDVLPYLSASARVVGRNLPPPVAPKVSGLDDPKVIETATGLHEFRAKHRREYALMNERRRQGIKVPEGYEPPPEWRGSATALAEVTGIEHGAAGADCVRLRPLATIDGGLDSAFTGELTAVISVGDKSAIRERPHVGAKALVLLKRDEAGKYSIPDTPVDYFPADDHGNHPAYFEVIGFDNEDVDKVIENLRTLRAKDREAMEKKEVGANAATDSPKK